MKRLAKKIDLKMRFMQISKNVIVLLVFLQISTGDLSAATLKLPAILASHMVLQQQKSVVLWGWAKQGTRVTVLTSWNQTKASAKVSDKGTWEVSVTTPVAGGPYTITISADTTLILDDILIGEVWVCSGQSNMEMPLKGFRSQAVAGSNDHIARSRNRNIRLFSMARKMSVTPEEDCVGAWKSSGPEAAADFSAVAYFYGKYLNDVLDVPIGLIHASWGGTPAHSWTDKPTLENGFSEIDLSGLRGEKLNPRIPTVLYNGMIHPLLRFVIRGVIWYQGEADRMRPEQYAKLFPAMIGSWRHRWGLGEFPFYFVQIAPYKYDSTCNTAFLREAQLMTMQQVSNCGMAVTLDIGDEHSIHPSEKFPVGLRLAYWALAETYGVRGIAHSGPVFRDMKVDGNKIRLYFDHAASGFAGLGHELDGFQVAGDDKVFYPEKGIVNRDENCIEIRSAHVASPVAVRYGWENYFKATLYNTAGLPASSFRTDHWKK